MVAADFKWAMPAHNETMIEKEVEVNVLNAAESIISGKAAKHIEGVANGIKVRRYNYERFSLIVRAP